MKKRNPAANDLKQISAQLSHFVAVIDKMMSAKKSAAPLGELEMLVLLAVRRLEDGAYGIRVLQELDETAQRRLTRGTIYATLQRLEDKGLLASRLGEATAERGGRAKRYYSVTVDGVAALRRGVGAIRALSEGLEGTLL